jgi:hypothetical protein
MKPELKHALELTDQQQWRYETDEFHGICEIAKDDMVVKVVFDGTGGSCTAISAGRLRGINRDANPAGIALPPWGLPNGHAPRGWRRGRIPKR